MSQSAFITGATSGIGYATAKVLASRGYRLGIVARNSKKLEAVKQELEMKFNSEVYTYVLDVRDAEAIKQVAAQAVQDMGVPDVLVNNAGLARGLESYEETDEADIIQMVDTNIKGLFLVTHAFLPGMVKRNTGHIINLGSTAGLYAYKGAAVYCATKAAVKTFSDGIRIDTIDTDIKVTTIQPGIVHTPFSEVRFHGDKKRADAVYEGVDALHPEDIADVIAFVLDRPLRVQISDIVIMADQQATGFMVSKTPRVPHK